MLENIHFFIQLLFRMITSLGSFPSGTAEPRSPATPIGGKPSWRLHCFVSNTKPFKDFNQNTQVQLHCTKINFRIACVTSSHYCSAVESEARINTGQFCGESIQNQGSWSWGPSHNSCKKGLSGLEFPAYPPSRLRNKGNSCLFPAWWPLSGANRNPGLGMP